MKHLLGKHGLVYLLLIFACLITYLPGLKGPLVFDDLYWYRNISYYGSLDTTNFFEKLTGPVIRDTAPYGRPLLKLLYTSQCFLFKSFDRSNPWPFHIVSLILHMANCILVWTFLRKMLALWQPQWIVLLTLIWALHPLQTDAVLYVTQQSELMVSLWILLTLNLAIRKYKTGAITCCLIGMFCKELMVVTPLLTWLAISNESKKKPLQTLREHKWFLSLLTTCCFVVVVLMWFYPRARSTGNIHGWDNWNYLLTQSHVLSHYLFQCFWPNQLAIDPYFVRAESILDIWPYGLLIVSLLMATGTMLYKRHRMGFWPCWFFIILAPTTSLIPIVTEVAAHRRMYLPILGVIVLTGWLITKLTDAISKPQLVTPILGLCVLGVSVFTFQRSFVYQDAIQLHEEIRDKFPLNNRALKNLGGLYFYDQRYEDALEQYNTILNRRPHSPSVQIDRAKTLNKLGRIDEVGPIFKNLITAYPNEADYHYRLGWYYAQTNQPQQAIEQFETTLKLVPDYSIAMSGLAKIYYLNQDFEKALSWQIKSMSTTVQDQSRLGLFVQTSKLAGDSEDFFTLGLIYINLKRWNDAKDAFAIASDFPIFQLSSQSEKRIYEDAVVNLKRVNKILAEQKNTPTLPKQLN